MFTKDIEVVRLGGDYLAIVALSYVLVTVTTVYATVIRSTGNAIMPMIVSMVGLVLNTVLNYVLIFGHFGAPALGVKGAAIATLIARTIEMLTLLMIVYGKKYIVAGKINELFHFSGQLFFKRFMSKSGLLIIKDIVWGLGMTVVIAIYSRISTEAVAAVNITNTVFFSLMYVFFIIGSANGCLIMVGHKLGNNEMAIAYDYALFFRRFGMLISGLLTFVVIALRPVILMPFNVSELVVDYVMGFLLVKALFFMVITYNNISIVGILRAGGDTIFCLILDLVAVWGGIGIPLAYIVGLTIKAPVVWVMVAVTSQEVFKVVFVYFRVKSKKWMNNLVSDISERKDNCA